MTSPGRSIAVSALVGLALTVGLTAGAGAVAPATSRSITAKPSTGLKDHQTVDVHGAGFPSKTQLYLVECLRGAKGASQCDESTATLITSTSKGLVPVTKFTVVTGKIGTGECGTSAATLAHCDLSIGTASGSDTATAPITFAAPKKKS